MNYLQIKSFLVLIAFVLYAITCPAQSRDTVVSNVRYQQELNVAYSQLYVLNSDIGDITFGDQGHPQGRQYILNGNLLPHYYVFPRKWPLSLVLSPIVRARIIANQPSGPVRTPSFVLGGQVYFPVNRYRLDHYQYIGIGAFHHSNGQDGPPLDSAGNPNLYNGNFSTNFLNADYHWGYINERRNDYFRLGLEAHSGLLHWGDEPAYRNRFGKLRLNYHFAHARFVKFVRRFLMDRAVIDSTTSEEERWRFVATGMIVLDHIDADWNQHFNLELKYYRKIMHSENAAFFFSTGYMGHDYYNIYFYQPYPFVRVGFAASNAFFYNNRFKVQRQNVQRLRALMQLEEPVPLRRRRER